MKSNLPTEEDIAKAFHMTYEHLAPNFNYETRRASAVPWERVPEKNRQLMMAVIHDLLATDVIRPGSKR